MKILFTGGGTGGHFYPIVAIIRETKRIIEEEKLLNSTLYYIGPNNFGHEILKKEGVETIEIISGKLRRYASAQNFFDIFRVIVGVLKAFFVLFSMMPDVIFSKGGYGSLPVVLVAIIYRIPLIIHESDSVPGVVNAFAARFASRVAVSFESTLKLLPKKSLIGLVGNPVRQQILGGSREAANEELVIFAKRFVVLVMGGSQGSQILNSTLVGAIKELAREFEIIHQTGEALFQDAKGEISVILSKEDLVFYHPYAFFDDRTLRNAYAAADIIVSRAGAGSIFEIAAVGKPAILIPLKNSAQEHQKNNAYEYANRGAAIVIEEENLTPNVFLNEIKKLAADESRRKIMSEQAALFAKVNAAEVIAKEILKLGLHL